MTNSGDWEKLCRIKVARLIIDVLSFELYGTVPACKKKLHRYEAIKAMRTLNSDEGKMFCRDANMSYNGVMKIFKMTTEQKKMRLNEIQAAFEERC